MSAVMLFSGNCHSPFGPGYFVKELQLAHENGGPSGVASSYSRIADAYVLRKETAKALSYLSGAETTFETIEDKLELVNIHDKQYEICFGRKNRPEAIEVLKKR